jgi:hypothetical protein
VHHQSSCSHNLLRKINNVEISTTVLLFLLPIAGIAAGSVSEAEHIKGGFEAGCQIGKLVIASPTSECQENSPKHPEWLFAAFASREP